MISPITVLTFVTMIMKNQMISYNAPILNDCPYRFSPRNRICKIHNAGENKALLNSMGVRTKAFQPLGLLLCIRRICQRKAFKFLYFFIWISNIGSKCRGSYAQQISAYCQVYIYLIWIGTQVSGFAVELQWNRNEISTFGNWFSQHFQDREAKVDWVTLVSPTRRRGEDGLGS